MKYFDMLMFGLGGLAPSAPGYTLAGELALSAPGYALAGGLAPSAPWYALANVTSIKVEILMDSLCLHEFLFALTCV